ncbi:hypothetical protein HK102_008492, partial [Quaeritorhiza haematococci]
QNGFPKVTTRDVFESRSLEEFVEAVERVDVSEGLRREVSDEPLVSAELLAEIKSTHLPSLGFVNVDDEVEDIYPALPLQSGLLSLTVKQASAYAVQHVWDLSSSAIIDEQRLRAALQKVFTHHPILRTCFVHTDDGFYQVVASSAAVSAALSQDKAWFTSMTWNEQTVEKDQEAFLSMESARGFTLQDRHFARVALARIQGDGDVIVGHRLLMTINHVLFDGWSLPMLVQDFQNAYAGTALEPRPSLRNYVAAVCATPTSSTESYWRTLLENVSPTPSIGGNRNGVRGQATFEMFPKTMDVDVRDLNAFAKMNGVTAATVVNAAWALVLKLYLSRDDVVFGTVVSGRDFDVEGVERIVGMLINTVPVRVQMTDSVQSIHSLLQSLKSQFATSMLHAQANLIDVQKWAGHSEGLFNSLVAYENIPSLKTTGSKGTTPTGLQLSHRESTGNAYNYEMEVVLFPETEGKLGLNIVHDTSSIRTDMVVDICSHFEAIIGKLVSDWKKDQTAASRQLSTLFGLSPEHAQRLTPWQSGPTVPISDQCAHEVFEQFVLEQPYAIAVESQDAKITYQELDHRANMVANELRKLGVRPGVQVACVISRSVEMVVGILGVLKAGAAYVPVDFSVPEQRISSIFEDISCEVVLATAKTVDAVPESHRARARLIDDYMREDLSRVARSAWTKPKELATNNDLAYIIFTS